MKAILEFNLDNYQDKIDHLRCIKATNMFCALYDIRNIKRQIEKNVDLTDDQDELLDDIFKRIFYILEENDINLGELE